MGEVKCQLYTTEAVDAQRCIDLLRSIRDSVAPDLSGEYLRPSDRDPITFSDISALDAEQIGHWEGQFAIAFSSERACMTGGADLFMLRKPGRRIDLASAAHFQQNCLTFEFKSSPSQAASFREPLVALIASIAKCVRLTYGYAEFGLTCAPVERHPAGLEGGLPGVYWINVLGKEFIDAIGRERILNSRVTSSVRLPGSAVLLEAWHDPAGDNSGKARELIAALGEDALAPATLIPQGPQSGRISLFGLIRDVVE